MSHDKTLVLIDGSSYLFRAYHALPPLSTSYGFPTGAMYGVLNMIRKTLSDYPADYVAVVFDAKGKTFRDELYEQYKAHRPEIAEDLYQQFPPLYEIIEAQGLPLLMVDGVEADDVIGTLALRAKKQDFHVIISTGDKDMAQLVNSRVKLINTMSDKHYDIQGVHQRFGVAPEQMIDYLALVGDTTDNIPGVPKVGPKTAAKWLQKYGSLDHLLEHRDEIKGKVGDNLRSHLDQLELSRQLVTLDLNVDVGVKLEDLKPKEPDHNQLMELYKKYELQNLLNELLGQQAHSSTADYQVITDKTTFQKWLHDIEQAEMFAIDTETTNLDAISAELVGISLAYQPQQGAYIPLAHRDMTEQLDRDWVLNQLKPLLEDTNHVKIGHNLKYDITVLSHYDIELQGSNFDTMLESYLLNPSTNRHDLDSSTLKYLGQRTVSFEEIAGKGKNQLTFDQIPIDKATVYAAEDADMALQLHHHLWPQLSQYEGIKRAFETIEMPLVPVLARIERNGVKIDIDQLSQQSQALTKQIKTLEAEAFKLAGRMFNLGSPKQLQEILFDVCKLPILKKTPKGQPSTAEWVLHQLAFDYPLPDVILKYRSLSKLKSTYTDRLPEQVNPKTGRVHTSYNQAVTATGRLSSTNPNLQNIPIRTEEGRKIRQAFIAEPGCLILAADYSQIELRIMAHIADDTNLKQAFAQNLDIHRATASEVFGVDLEAVTDLQRRSAKAINFGLLYGMSPYGLAQQLGIEQSEAEAYVLRYFQKYPGVKMYMDQIRQQAMAQGYVETLFGRRLYLPEIQSANIQRQRAAERAAINAPMQGSAADIIKRAMIEIDAWLQTNDIQGRMIMQVHDELIFEIDQNDIDTAKSKIPQFMAEAAELSVPLIADVGVGKNWAEAH